MTSFTPHWHMLGNCANSNDEVFFLQGKAQNDAIPICKGCVVQAPCLAEALDNDIEFGVWGGLNERQRRAVKKRRPNVKSWAALLHAAESAHAAEQVLRAIDDVEHGIPIEDDDEIDDLTSEDDDSGNQDNQ